MYKYEELSTLQLLQERRDIACIVCISDSQRVAKSRRLAEIDRILSEREKEVEEMEARKMVDYVIEFTGTLRLKGKTTSEVLEKLNKDIGSVPNIVFESIVITKE